MFPPETQSYVDYQNRALPIGKARLPVNYCFAIYSTLYSLFGAGLLGFDLRSLREYRFFLAQAEWHLQG